MVAGQLPEMLVQPVVFIFLIVSAYLLFGKGLTVQWALGMNIVAAGGAFFMVSILLYKVFPQAAREASPSYQTSVWVRSALPLLFITSMSIINDQSDIIFLGAIKEAEAVGSYAIANRGAMLISALLFAVNTAMGPSIARLHAKGDKKQLQRMITKSARVTTFVSLPVAGCLIAFGDEFLMIFGRDFTEGKVTLAILSAGQIVNVALGSSALLLIMTGHERHAAIGLGISALLNVVLNALLIPPWGLVGAATAKTSSMVLWNVLLAIWVYKRIGIHSTVLGRVRERC
jgi:O-antigen/teichoic acid export membrane protein